MRIAIHRRDRCSVCWTVQAVRASVEQLQADDLAKLSTRRKGKLLVLDVGARMASANQKWIEVQGDEDDGIE